MQCNASRCSLHAHTYTVRTYSTAAQPRQQRSEADTLLGAREAQHVSSHGPSERESAIQYSTVPDADVLGSRPVEALRWARCDAPSRCCRSASRVRACAPTQRIIQIDRRTQSGRFLPGQTGSAPSAPLDTHLHGIDTNTLEMEYKGSALFGRRNKVILDG